MVQRTAAGWRHDRDDAAQVMLRVRLDGVDYEIDLSLAEARKLRAALRPWIAHARQVSGPAPVGQREQRVGTTRIDRLQMAKMREWAVQNGHPVSPRGRVPVEVQRAFADAHA